MKNAVGRLDGVQHVEVELGTRLVRITPSRDRTLDFAAIDPAVRTRSARVVRMRISAKGVVEHGADGAGFRIDGWPTAFPIDGIDPPDGPCTIRANVRVVDGTPRLHLLED